LDHLLDASFLGKLLALPANVIQDWKVIVRYKHSSLIGLIISNEGKKFYNIDTWQSFTMSGLPEKGRKMSWLFFRKWPSLVGIVVVERFVIFFILLNAFDQIS
jgi:hypothetical protein